MPNPQNVTGINEKRTPEQRKRIARKAGKASGEARRERADLRKALQGVIETEYTDEDGTTLTGANKMAVSLFAIASDPSNKGAAVQAFNVIARTLGQDAPEREGDDDMVLAFIKAMRGD